MAQYYKHGTILDISISPSESKLLLELVLFDILLILNLIPPSVAYIYVKAKYTKRETRIDGKVFIHCLSQCIYSQCPFLSKDMYFAPELSACVR